MKIYITLIILQTIIILAILKPPVERSVPEVATTTFYQVIRKDTVKNDCVYTCKDNRGKFIYVTDTVEMVVGYDGYELKRSYESK